MIEDVDGPHQLDYSPTNKDRIREFQGPRDEGDSQASNPYGKIPSSRISAKAESAYSGALHQSQPVQSLTAKEIMSTPLLHIKEESSLQEACMLLSNNKISHVPVVDDKQSILGILSDKDIIHHLSSNPNQFKYPAKEIMSTPVYSIHEETLFPAILKTMTQKNIGSLPVLDKEQIPQGIITKSDLLKHLLPYVPFKAFS